MNPQDFGKYRLQEKIGQGGMAEVFYAHIVGREGFTKEVALKRVLPHLCEDADFVKSFVDEARLGGLLNHHHIVQTLDFGQEQGIYYLAMEYVHGLTLREVINYHNKQRSPIPPSIVLDLILQFCDGLRYAHNAEDELGNPLNMVHRDLKPTNILVSSHGVVKIADFGIARAETNLRRTTYDGVLKGTAQYMSPEQALGDLSIDRRSDLFSVGSIAYEMISLRSLFYDPTNSIKTLRNVQDANVGDALGALNRDFPYTQRLVPLLEWLLQRERNRRPGGVEEILPELRRIHASLSRQLDMQGWAEQILVALGRPVRSRRSTTQTMRVVPVTSLGVGVSAPPPAPPPVVPLAGPSAPMPPSAPAAASSRPMPSSVSASHLPPGFVPGRPSAAVQEPSGSRAPSSVWGQEPSGGRPARAAAGGGPATESLLGPPPGRPGGPSGAFLTTATLADVPIQPGTPPARLAAATSQPQYGSPAQALRAPVDDERTTMGLELEEDESEGARATVNITAEELRQVVTEAARSTGPAVPTNGQGASPSQPFRLQMPPPMPPSKAPSQGFALPPPQTSTVDDWADLRTTALEVPKSGAGSGFGMPSPPERPAPERKVQLTGPVGVNAGQGPTSSPGLQNNPASRGGVAAPMPASWPVPPAPAPAARPGASGMPSMPQAPPRSPGGGDWADIQTRAIDPAFLPGGMGQAGFGSEVTEPDPFSPGGGAGGGWSIGPAPELPTAARVLVKQVEDARAATAAALLGGGPQPSGGSPGSAQYKAQPPPGVMVAQVRPGQEGPRGWGAPELPPTAVMDVRQAHAVPPAAPGAGGSGRENSQPGFRPAAGPASGPAPAQQSVRGGANPVQQSNQGWSSPGAVPSGAGMAGVPPHPGQGGFPGGAPNSLGPNSLGAHSAGMSGQPGWGQQGLPPAAQSVPGGQAGVGMVPPFQGNSVQNASGMSGQGPQAQPGLAPAPVVEAQAPVSGGKKLPLGMILAGLGLLVAIAIVMALLA